MDSLDKVGDARSLAQIVVETVHEPLLVLNEDFTILAASDSFHKSFGVTSTQTFHHPFFTLDSGTWDLPVMRQLLGKVLAEQDAIEGLEFAHDFPELD